MTENKKNIYAPLPWTNTSEVTRLNTDGTGINIYDDGSYMPVLNFNSSYIITDAVCASTGNIVISSAPSMIDNVGPSSGDIILLWQQTNSSENGLYTYAPGVYTKLNYLPPLVYVINGQVNGGKSLVLSEGYYIVYSYIQPTKSVLQGFVGTDYSGQLGVGDHIQFDTTSFSRGGSIGLSASSVYNIAPGILSKGRIALAQGKTYKLTGSINNVTGFNYSSCQWYDMTTTASPLGYPITSMGYGGTSVSGINIQYITTTQLTFIELQIVQYVLQSAHSPGASGGPSWFIIEEI